MGGGVVGGVGVYTIIGEGDHWAASFVWWELREVRIAWHARVDLVQASQFRGLS